MKYFCKMIEMVNRGEIYISKKSRERVQEANISMKEALDETVDAFTDAVKKARVFVFEKEKKGEASLAPPVEAIEDPPFAIFSIELTGDNCISIPLPNEAPIYIYCLLCIEAGPRDFVVYSLFKAEHTDKWGVIGTRGGEVLGIVQAFVNRINREKMGLEKTRIKMKVGNGKSKYRHEIREVIHISPKIPTEGESPEPGTRHIDWTHRFEVRGHWRKHEGIGKNRDGQYCVEGYTWVKDHVRGPEELPLVKKQRIIDE